MKYNYFYRYKSDNAIQYGVHETDVLNDWLMGMNDANQSVEILGMFKDIDTANKFYNKCEKLGLLEDRTTNIPVHKVQKMIDDEKEVSKAPKQSHVQKPKKTSTKPIKQPKISYTQEQIDMIGNLISTIDLTKCGWVGKMIKATGLNKGIVHKIMSIYFKDEYDNAYHHVEKYKQVWVCNNEESKRISEDKLEEYIKNGWKKGKGAS